MKQNYQEFLKGLYVKGNEKSRHDNNNIKLTQDCNAQLGRDECQFFSVCRYAYNNINC